MILGKAIALRVVTDAVESEVTLAEECDEKLAKGANHKQLFFFHLDHKHHSEPSKTT